MAPKPTGGKVDALMGTRQKTEMTPLPGLSTTGRLALPMATKATKAMMQTGSQVPHPSPTDGKAGLGRRGAESHDMKVL